MSNETKFLRNRGLSQIQNVAFWLLDNLIWPILFIAIIGFALLLPEIFLSGTNIRLLFYGAAALGVLSLAEALTLLSGNFDISLGSVAAFSAMFTAVLMTEWFPDAPAALGIVVVLLVGTIIGSLNGFSVAYLGINPLLQTITFFIVFRGLTEWLSVEPITGLSDAYLYVGGGSIGQIPFAVIILFALFIVTGFILNYRPSGLAIYATGGDKDAAVQGGINSQLLVLSVFTIAGMLSGLAGLILTGYIGAATPSLAKQLVFNAFAAAVIGGISIHGGRGNISGVFGGVILLSVIQVGLTQLSINPVAVKAINGTILLAAIILYTFEDRLRTKLLTLTE